MQKALVCLGCFVHLLLLYAIFDIYYASPLVKSARAHPPTNGAAPARRLALLSADGLRAESFFDHPEKAPFLHSIIREGGGAWGISRSHVPTESRPGHVALIAGFYEDVSAITRGWKANPVPFDSLFNRSRTTWAWGSPDILPMFAEGVAEGHMHSVTYQSENEDFASGDASRLDTWVFDHVHDFFESARNNSALHTALHQDRIVFFLHLLGLDTNGHGYNPSSSQYLNNIAVVDEGIRNFTRLLADFYQDDKTAFVFTSDHGMTDWGSHGSGSDHEIMTPVVAWGAGVKQSKTTRDIDQVDLAPFMASLIGVAVPMNSVGRLPIEYLNATPKYLFQASCANLKQVTEQFLAKRALKLDHSLPFLFREFADFTPGKRQSVENEVIRLAEQKRFDTAAAICAEWVPTVIRGLNFFHRYERMFLGAAIALSYVSWMLLVLIFITRRTIDSSNTALRPTKTALIVAGCISLLLFAQQLPISNYIYCLLPVYLLSVCWNIALLDGRRTFSFRKPTVNDAIKWFMWSTLGVNGLAVLVLSFTERRVISAGLMALSVWPHAVVDDAVSSGLRKSWSVCCIILAVFPFLPTVGQTPVAALAIGTPLFVALALCYLIRKELLVSLNAFVTVATVATMGISSLVIWWTMASIDAGSGSPLLCRLFSWLVLLSSPFLPLLTDVGLQTRLAHWATALFLPYALLTIGYESVFFVVFCSLLYFYLRIEFAQMRRKEDFSEVRLEGEIWRSIGGKATGAEWRDWRRAYLLIFFMLTAFFGTGNVASLNSFNPRFLRCFVTVFSPFVMAALLLLKIIIPFVLVAIVYFALEVISGHQLKRISAFALIISDAMALVFFFQLKDDGSWLDIGISISHYVICLATATVLFVLLQFAALITTYRLPVLNDAKRHVI